MRRASLDFIKVVSTVLIVFHHYCQSTGAYFDGGINFAGGVFPFGYLVELFFLISGMMMYRYVDRIMKDELGFRKFFVTRYSRLMPLVFVSAVSYMLIDSYVYYPIMGSFFSGKAPAIWGGVLDMLCLQTGWLSENEYMINNPTWYVSTLLLCYVVFYFITEICRKKKKNPWRAFIIMSAIGVFEWIVWNITGFQIPFINSASARGFMSFFGGLVFSRELELHLKDRKVIHYLIACVFLVISVFVVKVGVSFLLPVGLALITYPSIIYLFTGLENTVFFKKSGGLWSLLAQTAYSVYIWHVCGLMLFEGLNVRLDLGVNWNEPIVMYIFVGLMEILAFPSFWFIERKLNSQFDKLLTKLYID